MVRRKARGDLVGCKVHERQNFDPTGQRIRLGSRTPACWAMEDAKVPEGKGLTLFLVRLLAMTNAEVVAASPAKGARQYGIRADWAAEYIRMEKEKRSIA